MRPLGGAANAPTPLQPAPVRTRKCLRSCSDAAPRPSAPEALGIAPPGDPKRRLEQVSGSEPAHTPLLHLASAHSRRQHGKGSVPDIVGRVGAAFLALQLKIQISVSGPRQEAVHDVAGSVEGFCDWGTLLDLTKEAVEVPEYRRRELQHVPQTSRLASHREVRDMAVDRVPIDSECGLVG